MSKRPKLRTLGARVPALGSRVPTMSATSAGPSWRTGMTTTERGYNYRWQQARASFLQQHPLCVRCADQDVVRVATVVDHRVPHRGDMALFWDPDNWQSLCAPCHDGWKQGQERLG